MATYPLSDHCDGERFFNPHAVTGRSLREVLRWMRTRERTAWPRSMSAAVPSPSPPSRVEPGQVAVTFIGHSTFLIRTATAVMITDPVFTSHAGPFGRLGPKRARPPAIPLHDLPPVDVVLLSHNHYDHLQPSSLAGVPDAAIVTSLGVPRYLSSRRAADVRELDWWGSAHVRGVTITAVPAQHFSARTPWDKNHTLWSGFVVETGGGNADFPGDTRATPQVRADRARVSAIATPPLPGGAPQPPPVLAAR